MATPSTNPILAQANRSATPTIAPTPTPSVAPPAISAPAEVNVAEAVEAFKTSVAEHKKLVDEQRQRVEAEMQATSTTTDQIVDSINKEANNKIIAKRAKLNEALNTSQANRAVYEAAGGSENQTQLMEKYKRDTDRVSELLAKQSDIMNDESGSNPITSGIKNMFRAIPTQIALKYAKQEEDHTAMQIGNMISGQSGFMQINERVKATVTQGAMEANLNAMEAGVRTEAHRAKLDALQTNAAAFNRIIAASSSQMANQAKAYELARQERVDPYMIPAQIANAQQVVFDYNSNRELLADHTDSAQRGQAIVKGAGGYDTPAAIADALKQGGPEEAKYRKWIEIGKTGIVGSTPSQARAALNTVAPSGNFAATKATELLAFIGSQQATAQLPDPKTGARKLPLPKSVAEDQAQFDNIALESMSIYAANASTQGNPYRAPPTQIVATMLAHRGNKFFEKIVSKAMPTELNEVAMLSLAVDSIKSGQFKDNQVVADIVEIFEAAADANNIQDGGFARFGLRPQTEYNVMVPVSRTNLQTLADAPLGVLAAANPALGTLAVSASARLSAKYETVDLMDRAEVANILAKLRMQTKKAPPVNSSNEGTK